MQIIPYASKNLLIGLVTMVGKVGAIDGGMDVEESTILLTFTFGM